MDIISIITSIGGLVGTFGGLYMFLFVRQEREKRELDNDSQIIQQYEALAASHEAERQRLRIQADKLEAEVDKYRTLWEKERCVINTCKFRRPPLESEMPHCIEDTF